MTAPGDQAVDRAIDEAMGATLGEHRERGGRRVALYEDLVRVHVENGVLVVMAVILTANLLVLAIAIPLMRARDTYVVPGPVTSGTAVVEWGQVINESMRHRLEQRVAEQRAAEERRARRLRARREAVYAPIDASRVPTVDPARMADVPDADADPDPDAEERSAETDSSP